MAGGAQFGENGEDLSSLPPHHVRALGPAAAPQHLEDDVGEQVAQLLLRGLLQHKGIGP